MVQIFLMGTWILYLKDKEHLEGTLYTCWIDLLDYKFFLLRKEHIHFHIHQ